MNAEITSASSVGKRHRESELARQLGSTFPCPVGGSLLLYVQQNF